LEVSVLGHIVSGVREGIQLILGFDQEIYAILFLSLIISLVSTGIASAIGIPLGLLTGIKTFSFKKTYSRVLYTLMSLPPVVVGLIVAIFLSRQGPLGNYRLMYTPTAMIIAQTILVTPIVTGNVFNHSKEHGKAICDLGKTLGANQFRRLILLIKELRAAILIAIVSGLGRAISEVGAVMIVGGNIKNHTRVMTTYIAMNNTMGNYSTSIAMGIILLSLAFILNSILYTYISGDEL
jgi:tungstate transport system permease protein